ncbi:MAG: hypothetical protein HY282_13280 [Nitrospirae bacterium]|nr:hypothetical protein [Candidatus Manganitrophaceae bacterium]
MSFLKHQVLVGLVMVQAIVILFLVFNAILLRNDLIFAEGQVNSYKKAFTQELESADPEDPLLRELTDERNTLLREYSATHEVARTYGIKSDRSN